MRRKDADVRAEIYKEIRSRAHTSTSNNLSFNIRFLYHSPSPSAVYPQSHKARLNRETLVEYAHRRQETVPATISLIFRITVSSLFTDEARRAPALLFHPSLFSSYRRALPISLTRFSLTFLSRKFLSLDIFASADRYKLSDIGIFNLSLVCLHPDQPIKARWQL